MRYCKIVADGYIVAIGKSQAAGVEITAAEYAAIEQKIESKPAPPVGYDYRLTETMNWEQYKLPESKEEVTAEEAMNILTGGDSV